MTDPTKREVLTGPELETAYWSGKGDLRSNLRAVEQAVLAKLHDDESPVNGHWECFSPADARELERKAFLAGWAGGNPESESVVLASKDFRAIRDRLYPSLTPPKPKGVTLSDGKVWRRTDDGGWKYSDHRFEFDAPLCSTPEDFEAVARYLRELDT